MIPFWNKFKIRILLSLLIGLGIAVFVQMISRRAISKFMSSNEELIENFETAKLLEGLKAAVLSFESSARGYYISGDSIHLSNFNSNIVTAQNYVSFLKIELDEPEFKKDFADIGSLLEQKIKISKKVVSNYNDSIINKQLTIDHNINEGKILMDSLDKIATNLLSIVDQKIQEVISENHSRAVRVLLLQSLGSFLAGLVVTIGIFFLFKDIERREKLEAALHRAKEAAEQNKLLEEQFMANMSHEIRTPLNAILGFTGLLSRTDLSTNQEEYVESIHHASENLLSIVNDILDFSKIEEGMMHFEKTTFSLREVFSTIERLFIPKVEEKHIQLIIDIQSEMPDIFIGDPFRLTQVLFNLVSNALKFTHKGFIKVTVSYADKKGNDLNLIIKIEDTGIGIPSHKLTDIFKRFQQAEADTTRRFGGAGLGLSIVNRLLELQGGHIDVSSTEGVGACFTVTLPVKEGNPKNVHPVQRYLNKTSAIKKRWRKPEQLIGSLNILIAEDNPLNQRLLQILLSEWGLRFEIVENGQEAIDALRRKSFDVVLMDIQMPKMDGYSATLHIREQWGDAIPIIAMTAHAMKNEREKCMVMGMNDYLIKPIQEKDLRELLKRWAVQVKKKKTFAKDRPTPREQFPSLTGALKLINLDYLMEISNGKITFIKEMAELFLKQAPIELMELQRALEASDPESIRKTAHSMKSSVSFIGLADSVSGPLDELESAAANGNLQDCRIRIQQLNTLIKEAKMEVEDVVLGQLCQFKTTI